MSAALAAALRYHELGMSVIPITPGGHVPLVRWKMYQTTKASAAEITDWFRRWPAASVGIVTGEISELVVLDFDPRNGPGLLVDEKWCPTVATPGGGRHYYFTYHAAARTSHPLGHGTSHAVPGLDVQSDKAYVVAPPSRRNGKVYQFVGDTARMLAHLPDLPEDILHRLYGVAAEVELELLAAMQSALQHRDRGLPTVGSAGHGLALDDALRFLPRNGRPAKQTSPGQWMVQCPLHEDTKPSLAVSTGKDGRLLLYCHAGCSFPALIHYLTTLAAEVTG